MITYFLYGITIPLMVMLSLLPISSTSTFASGPETMTIEPTTLYSQIGEEHHITIKGGLPPYRWYTVSGDIKEKNENIFTYTAPGRFGTDQATFEDKAGQKVQIQINIIRPLSLSPTKFDLNIKDEAAIRVSGGSGQWCVAEHTGIEIIETNSSFIKIKPEGETGLKKIVIQDTVTKESANIEINIFGNMEINIEK